MQEMLELTVDVAADLLTMFVYDFVFDGSHIALDLAKSFRDDEGNPPPVDEMVTYVLIEEGRLLTA